MYRVLSGGGRYATNISGLELADNDTRLIIDAVGEDYFLENMRKIGLSISTEEALEELINAGFRDVSAIQLENSDVINGQKRIQ
jgi:hypothetical protein